VNGNQKEEKNKEKEEKKKEREKDGFLNGGTWMHVKCSD